MVTVARRQTPPEPVQRVTTIPITCRRHGAVGFCNLRIQRRGDHLELNPHVTSSCVLALTEETARRLRDEIDSWLA